MSLHHKMPQSLPLLRQTYMLPSWEGQWNFIILPLMVQVFDQSGVVMISLISYMRFRITMETNFGAPLWGSFQVGSVELGRPTINMGNTLSLSWEDLLQIWVTLFHGPGFLPEQKIKAEYPHSMLPTSWLWVQYDKPCVPATRPSTANQESQVKSSFLKFLFLGIWSQQWENKYKSLSSKKIAVLKSMFEEYDQHYYRRCFLSSKTSVHALPHDFTRADPGLVSRGASKRESWRTEFVLFAIIFSKHRFPWQ